MTFAIKFLLEAQIYTWIMVKGDKQLVMNKLNGDDSGDLDNDDAGTKEQFHL